MKMNNIIKIISVFALCSSILLFSSCKSEDTSKKTSKKTDKSNASSSVSIYYKDDVSSETYYEDIIPDGSENSTGGNLADDANPQLIIPGNQNSESVSHNSSLTSSSSTSSKEITTSSKPDSSSKPEQTSSGMASSNASSAESTIASSTVSSAESGSSYDKGYTKPY